MKQSICTWAVFCLLLTGFTAYAQNPDELMKEMASMPEADYYIFDAEMLEVQFQLLPEATKEKMISMADTITRMEIVYLDKYDRETASGIKEKLTRIPEREGYETLVRVKEDNEDVRIISYKEENIVRDIYIFVMDKEDLVFIKITGKLAEETFTKLINEHIQFN